MQHDESNHEKYALLEEFVQGCPTCTAQINHGQGSIIYAKPALNNQVGIGGRVIEGINVG
jgi:hypothetical protein